MKNTLIEICFGDSECGLIKFALNKSGAVFNLCGALDQGKVDTTNFWASRKEWIDDCFGNYSPRQREKMLNEEKEKLSKVVTHARGNGSIRLWISNAAYSQCGYYWLISMLQEFDCEISVVELMGQSEKEESWGMVDPDTVRNAQGTARVLSREERNEIAEKWKKLCATDTPLRVMAEGELVGANEDYFDDVILSYAHDGEFSEIKLMSDVIGMSSHWLNDSFILKRIEWLISVGKLQVISQEKRDSSTKPIRILRRV